MSHSVSTKPYNQLYINAWTGLSIVLAITLLLMFANCDAILSFFHPIWNFIRACFTPII